MDRAAGDDEVAGRGEVALDLADEVERRPQRQHVGVEVQLERADARREVDQAAGRPTPSAARRSRTASARACTRIRDARSSCIAPYSTSRLSSPDRR